MIARMSRATRFAALALAALTIIALGAYALGTTWYGGDIEVGAHWPDKLSHSTSTRVAVTVRDAEGNARPGADIEIGYVPNFEPPLDDGRIWLTGSQSAELAEKTFDEDAFRSLARAEAGPHGTALLAIPPARDFLQTETPGLGETINLVLRVSDGPLDRWIGFAKIRRPSDEATVVLSTDRPLYQPGQHVQMRALVLDSASGEPLAAAGEARGAAVEFRVHGPRHNLLFRERALVSPAGVASHRFALAPDGQQGDYEVTVDYRGSTATRTVEVRPYETPRFEVELDASSDAGRVRGEVSADYFYGEPVADAKVVVEARPAGPHPGLGAPLAETSASLDESGSLSFDLELPADTRSRLLSGRLAVVAKVTDPSGGTQIARRTLAPVTDEYRVELLPAEGTMLRAGEVGSVVLVVRDRRGEPVSGLDARVEIGPSHAPETFEATTDESGRAAFEWTPQDLRSTGRSDLYHALVEARVELLPASGESSVHRVECPVAAKSAVIITPETATPSAGESVTFELDFPAASRPNAEVNPVEVLALHEGLPVAVTTVEVRGEKAKSSVELDELAVGLTRLLVLDRYRREIGAATLWVRQRERSSVAVDLGDGPHRPGGEASLGLSFPAGQDSPSDQAPVTFGAWAVDEALYALAERADLPLPLLARHSAETLAAVSDALEHLHDDPSSAPATPARLARDTHALQARSEEITQSLNGAFERYKKAPWIVVWVVLASLLIIALMGFEARRVWRLSRRDDPSWTYPALFWGIPVGFAAILTLAGWLISPGAAQLAFMAMISVLGLVGLIGLGRCLYYERELRFWQWLLTLAATAGLLGFLLWRIESLSSRPSTAVKITISALVLAAIIWVLQSALWGSVMWSRGRRIAALGPLVFIWALGGLIVVKTFGGTVQSKFAAASATVGNSVDFEEEAAEGMEMPAEGMEMAAEEMAAEESSETDDSRGKPNLRVRDFFPDTMFWMPEIASDADGHATIDVELPDSITTWRVHAQAHTADGRFGEGSAALEVRQPFFVELDLPTTLTAGDTLRLPIALVDGRRDPEGATRVVWNAKASGSLLADAAEQRVELAAGSREVVWLEVEATTPGEGTITVEARLEGDNGAAADFAGDAVRRSTTVVADGRRRSLSSSEVIDDGWTATFDIPADTVPGTASARLDLLPGPTAAALDGVESMLRKPLGCFEQTTSAAYPNVLILRSIEATAPERWPGGAEAHAKAKERAREFVSAGYQRILTFQTDSGGFALYPDHHEPSVILTGYGLLQLAAIQAALGLDAGPAMRRAARWLRSKQLTDGRWPADKTVHGGSLGSMRATAFVLWAIGRLPMADEFSDARTRGGDWLHEALGANGEEGRAGNFEKALAANAFLELGQRDRARSVLAALRNSVTRQDDASFWKAEKQTWAGGRGVYADVATTALATRALVRAGDGARLTNSALDYLAQMRRPDGGWGTTQATVWALDAMSSVPWSGKDDPVRVKVELDNEPMERADGRPGGEVRVIPDRGVPHTLRADIGPGRRVVSVTPESDTAVVAQATVDFAVPWNSPSARVDDEPFDVSLDLDSRSLTAGEPTRVEVTLTNRTGAATGPALARLPLLPGAAADAGMLEAMIDADQVDRVERTPTHLVVYLPGMQPGDKLTLPYLVVPRFSGRYSLPPVVAYPYYQPQPAAERPGGSVGVQP